MSNSLVSFLPFLLILTLVITSVGFKRMVYFLNIGYAFSIVAVEIAAVVFFWKNASLLSFLQAAAVTFWGLRLGIFVTKRELSAGYQKERDRIDQQYNRITVPVKFAIWISVSILYLCMVSPSLFSLQRSVHPGLIPLVFQGAGLLVIVSGLVLEGIADRQKSAFKASQPGSYCDVGLYRWVRCPNYLGEILVWVGNWIMGIGFYSTAAEWIISLIGAVCIVFIMFGSAKRLEKTQLSRYGNLSAYQQYCQTVPILIPGLSLYTLQDKRFLG